MIFRRIPLLAVALLIGLSVLWPVSLKVSAAAGNLIANPSVETADPTNSALPQNWLQGRWGTNQATFSYPSTGHSGNRSVEIQMSSYSSGDAKWYFDPVAVQAGSSYVYNDYYESSVATDVVAQFADAAGNYTYLDLGSAAASGNWQQYQATFEIPQNATSLTIFHLINKVGWLTTDDFSLAPKTAPTPSPTGNLIPNASLETSNGSLPAGWSEGRWGTNQTTFSYLNIGHGGGHSVEVQMSSYSSGDAKWYFDPVAVQASTAYAFSDYYESTTASDVVVQFADAAGNYTYLDLGSAAASGNWQQFSANFTTPASVVSLTIFHLINSPGSLTTDDYSLAVSTTPSVSITSPTTGSTVSGQATLSAQASSAIGIGSVQFMLDGQAIGNPVTSSPYQITWGSTAAANGSHTVTAVATGKDGTSNTSEPVNFTVSNANPVNGNLIPNPTLATVSPNDPSLPANWQHDSWGTNNETYYYSSNGYNGSSSVSVQMTQYTSGDAKWYFAAQPVNQDTQYRYSDYYKSTVQTQVVAVFNMADGSTQYQIIGLPDAASGWTKFSTGFSIPLGTSSVTVYHLINSVGTLTTSNFSLAPYTPIGFSRPLLTLTFDDGYASTYDYGLPLLKSYGFGSTQFIITGLVGQTGYMTKAEVKNLYVDGQEVASHTLTHSDLTKESPSTMTNEISKSQSVLKSWIGAPVTDFAYPYGLYNSSVLGTAAKYYAGARGVEDGLNSKDNFNPYDVRVQNVFINTSTAQIADWVKQAQSTNTWLVLVYHAVDPNTSSPVDGDQYNVTPSELSSQLAAIKASGIRVETMQAALAEVQSQL